MLRLWNPYSQAPMIFTKKLWEEGEDYFVDVRSDPPRMAKCDLFEWFHLTTLQRMHHLTMYARRVGLTDVPDQATSKADVHKEDEERHWEETDDCCYKCFTGTCKCWKTLVHCGRRHRSEDEPKDFSVVCVKTHTIDKEIEIEDTSFGPTRGKIRILRKRYTVPVHCKGSVTGRTLDDKLTVDWQLSTADAPVNLKTDTICVSQWTQEWGEFMLESGLSA